MKIIYARSGIKWLNINEIDPKRYISFYQMGHSRKLERIGINNKRQEKPTQMSRIYELATKLGITSKSSERVYAKFAKKQTAIIELIQVSFLSDGMKEEYHKLLKERVVRIC